MKYKKIIILDITKKNTLPIINWHVSQFRVKGEFEQFYAWEQNVEARVIVYKALKNMNLNKKFQAKLT